MAWTKVGETTFNINPNDINQDVSLPGSPAEDDIVIYAHSSDWACSPGVQTSGYTDLLTDHSAANPGRESGYKVMGGTPDTIITFNQDSTNPPAGEYTAGILQVWRGLDTTTPIDATPTTANSGTGMPDGPSYTTVTNGALVIVIGFLDDDNDAGNITAPSGYSNLLDHDNSGNADNATTMIASKELASAGAEDPAAFTSSTPATDAWYAVTFALRPASTGLTVSESESVSVSESISAILSNLTTSVNDSVSVAETVLRHLVSLIGESESVSVAEAISRQLVSFVSESEAVGVAESVGVSVITAGAIAASVNDSVNVAESVTISISNLTTSVNDSVSVAESISRQLTSFISENETVGVAESTTQTISNLEAAPTEAIGVAESVNVVVQAAPVGTLTISVNDSISVAESTSQHLVSLVNVNDSITVTDTPTITPLLIIAALSEAITVTDTATVSRTRTIDNTTDYRTGFVRYRDKRVRVEFRDKRAWVE
jgi:hypothetical protein